MRGETEQEAAREFLESARRWNRAAFTLGLWLVATVVWVAAVAATGGGLGPTGMVWAVPFWLAVLPGVLRWQWRWRRALEARGRPDVPLWRTAWLKFLLVAAVQWLPLSVVVTNITLMLDAATGVEHDAVAGGLQGGLVVAYLVWLAPARTVRETLPVLLGWAAVLLLVAAGLALAGLRPTDAL